MKQIIEYMTTVFELTKIYLKHAKHQMLYLKHNPGQTEKKTIIKIWYEKFDFKVV